MRMSFVTVMFLMACLSMVVSAQGKKVNFSGTWTLDLTKSKLDERARLESMTMTVTQTSTEIKIASKTVRSPRPEGSGGGTGGGGGFGRGGGFGNGDAVATYSLNGKESATEEDSTMGKILLKSKATLEAGKLSLVSSRTSTGAAEPMTATITEVWTISKDGKTLTAVREQTSPRGVNASTMVFVKK